MKYVIDFVNSLIETAKPVIGVYGVNEERGYWTRNVREYDSRNGRWLSLKYEIIDKNIFNTSGECLVFLLDESRNLRIINASDNLKTTWRESNPIYLNEVPDEANLRDYVRKDVRELFNRNGSKELTNIYESEKEKGKSYSQFEVRVIFRGGIEKCLESGDFDRSLLCEYSINFTKLNKSIKELINLCDDKFKLFSLLNIKCENRKLADEMLEYLCKQNRV